MAWERHRVDTVAPASLQKIQESFLGWWSFRKPEAGAQVGVEPEILPGRMGFQNVGCRRYP